jgi:predicted kinase
MSDRRAWVMRDRRAWVMRDWSAWVMRDRGARVTWPHAVDGQAGRISGGTWVTVIVVSGAPGTGKSTIAAAIAADLGWPLLALDIIKETLADVLGLGDEGWSNRVGDAAAEIVFRLSAQFEDAVVEGWWRGDRRVRALGEFAGAVEVFCRCEPQLAARRMRGRHGAGRHPIHRDVINPSVMDSAATLAATVIPLRLGAALVQVNTGEPDSPGMAVAAVAAALGR